MVSAYSSRMRRRSAATLCSVFSSSVRGVVCFSFTCGWGTAGAMLRTGLLKQQEGLCPIAHLGLLLDCYKSLSPLCRCPPVFTLADLSLSSCKCPQSPFLGKGTEDAGGGRSYSTRKGMVRSEDSHMRRTGRGGEEERGKMPGVWPQLQGASSVNSLKCPFLHASANPQPHSPSPSLPRQAPRCSALPWRAPGGPQRWPRPCTRSIASQSTGPQRPPGCPPGREEKAGGVRRGEMELPP